MNYSWLLIGAGGFVGSVARFLLQQAVQARWPLAWPVGTGAVNVLGCLMAGALLGWLERQELGAGWRLLLITGFCGGFTTFSAFALENVSLLKGGQPVLALAYATGSVLLGVLAAAGGYWLARG